VIERGAPKTGEPAERGVYPGWVNFWLSVRWKVGFRKQPVDLKKLLPRDGRITNIPRNSHMESN